MKTSATGSLPVSAAWLASSFTVLLSSYLVLSVVASSSTLVSLMRFVDESLVWKALTLAVAFIT